MLTIDEHIGSAGENVATRLQVIEETGAVRITIEDQIVGEIPTTAVVHVMNRYAKELAEGIVLDGPQVALAEGVALHMFRHRARYDVIARDFLVLTREGEEPIAELSTSIAAALIHLARAAQQKEATRHTS